MMAASSRREVFLVPTKKSSALPSRGHAAYSAPSNPKLSSRLPGSGSATAPGSFWEFQGQDWAALLKILMLLAAMAVGVLLGRPLYWAVEDRVREYTEQVHAERMGIQLQEVEEAPLLLSEDQLRVASEGREEGSIGGGEAAVEKVTLGERGAEEAEEGKGHSRQGKPAEGTDLSVGQTEKGDSSSSSSSAGSSSAGSSSAGSSSAGSSSAGSSGGSKGGEGEKESFAKGVRAIIHEGRPLLPALRHEVLQRPAEGVEVPRKEEFALRREMVDERAKDNVIVVTFANFAFLDFVMTWVHHLSAAGVSNLLVGAMDDQILSALFRLGVPVFDMESGMQAEDAGWGSPVFHAMGREKVTLINVFLAMGYNLLISDTDAIFLRDPMPFMARFPDADILTSSDQLGRTVNDESLEKWDQAWGAFNIGILFYRPTAAARASARAWAELLANDSSVWDQNGFNDIMRAHYGPAVEGGNGLVWAFDGSLKLGILPVSVFCSGHTFFIQRLFEKVHIPAYAIHTTFQNSGVDGKRHRLREATHFNDTKEYYDPPGGVLSFVPRIPEELLTGGEHNLESHFKLMNYQLRLLRSAFAIAIILKRTLVLPRIWARLDSEYFPHAGIVEGSDTTQPLVVPADHLLLVDAMKEGVLNPDQFGPPVLFREYSFLENPRVSQELLRSKLSVSFCERDSPSCPSHPLPPASPPFPPLSIPRLPKEGEIRSLLAKYSHVKWIEFESAEDAFGGWDDKLMEGQFRLRLKHTAAIWCCIYAHPGHIYYDFFADEKPNWKPMPPRTNSEDHFPV